MGHAAWQGLNMPFSLALLSSASQKPAVSVLTRLFPNHLGGFVAGFGEPWMHHWVLVCFISIVLMAWLPHLSAVVHRMRISPNERSHDFLQALPFSGISILLPEILVIFLLVF